MQLTYDSSTDTLTIVLRDVPISESDEVKAGLILDYDAEGNIVSMEILDASRRVTEPREMIFRLSGQTG